jgi:hypothetical protein
MSASWNNPALINKISDDVPAIKNLLIALFKMTDSNTEDVPTDAKRLYSVSGGVQFQKYTGTAWTSIGKLIHDVDMLDGKHATSSATADTIPVRDANGRLAGDILGNANTATTASSVASNYIVPVGNGGTGASDEAGARTNLGTNNAANITTGVLAIERGGTGSGTKNFVDLSTAQTIGGDKTFSGEVTLNKNVLKMTVLDTTEGATAERTDTVLQGISSNSGYGITALFGASGNAVIGAGEGKGNLLAELAGNTGEDVYIIADGAIHFHPNANTYADKKSVLLNASGELSGLAKVTAASFVGPLTGNASSATSATKDSANQQINTTYIKGLSVSGRTITYTKGDGTTGTITTQDTTYANFVKSGSTAKAGLVPSPGTTAGTTKYLREDCSWQVPPNTTYSAATQSANGLMSAADKKKLDGIATSANNYTHPTTAGNKHIPSGGSSGQILRWKASGEAQWGSDNNTTYSAATQSANGLMSAADKKKLDGIAAGATSGAIYSSKLTVTQSNSGSTEKSLTVKKGQLVLISMGSTSNASSSFSSGATVLGTAGNCKIALATSTTVKVKVTAAYAGTYTATVFA